MRSPFAKLVAASGLTNIGDGLSLIAWPWLATLLTRDPLLISLVPIAVSLPWFLFSLPAGIIIDRMHHRDVILMADAFRVVAYTIAAFAILANLPLTPAPRIGTHYSGLFILVSICAVIVGAAEALRDIAAQSYLPALVPSEQLEYANSWLQPITTVSNLLVGTAAAGVLINATIFLPFAVNAVLMAVAAILIANIPRSLRIGESASLQQGIGWKSELREGISFLLSHKVLLGFAVIYGIINFAFFGAFVTLVLIVQEHLQFGPLAMSAILASGALGGIAAGSVNKWLLEWFGRESVLKAGLLSVAAFPAAVLLSGPGWAGLVLICFGFFISEFCGVTGSTITISYRQRYIPPHLLGRVISVYRLILRGSAPLGILTAGVLVNMAENAYGREFALTVPYYVCLFIYILVAAASWRFLHRVFNSR